jgi:hypothetical protein
MVSLAIADSEVEADGILPRGSLLAQMRANARKSTNRSQ